MEESNVSPLFFVLLFKKKPLPLLIYSSFIFLAFLWGEIVLELGVDWEDWGDEWAWGTKFPKNQ